MQVYADSLNNQDLQKNNLSLEARYQSEKKQSQIVQLEKEKELQSLSIKQKNTFNALLGIGLLAAGIIGFLFYRNTKRKQQLSAQTQLIQQQQITQLEQEKQLVATTSILLGQEAERNRMAKDLHDGLGGMLSGIKLNLSSMQGNMIVHEKDVQLFSKSILQLDNAITEMRRVAHNMMPEALLKFGLSEAIQDYCDGINESNSVKMKFTQLGLQQPLDKPTEVILYRIVQELSNNAIKHAAAQNIFIQLNRHDKGISLTVEDDGKGFDTMQLATIKGAGLQNVQSRINYLKGSLDIDSVSNKGTSVNIEIPLQHA